MKREYLIAGLAFTSGACLAVVSVWTYWENKANEKYREWVKLREGTEVRLDELRKKRKTVAEIRTELREDLAVNEEMTMVYQPAPSTPPKPPRVDLSLNPEFSIISEEEYQDDEGFDKITVEVLRDDDQYLLVLDGETVVDWKDIITPDALEELRGKDELFLRNIKRREDYFLTWATP